MTMCTLPDCAPAALAVAHNASATSRRLIPDLRATAHTRGSAVRSRDSSGSCLSLRYGQSLRYAIGSSVLIPSTSVKSLADGGRSENQLCCKTASRA